MKCSLSAALAVPDLLVQCDDVLNLCLRMTAANSGMEIIVQATCQAVILYNQDIYTSHTNTDKSTTKIVYDSRQALITSALPQPDPSNTIMNPSSPPIYPSSSPLLQFLSAGVIPVHSHSSFLLLLCPDPPLIL